MEPPMSGVRPLEPGDPAQVGAYRLTGRLGAGGMGQVYLGVSRGGRKVAVKVLRADLVADTEFRTRFRREVDAARAVNGFYTAAVIDADPDATPPWMVTAYIDGPSLAAAVAEHGALREREVRDLAAALAEGLASVHAGGLVHRDLKPANIILASDGPRIIDFGIARAVGASTMTAQGTIIGTFTYMSPEQVMGFAASPKSDVFSLGSVLVFAATGHGPFEADSLPAVSHRILSEPPDLRGLPESLHDLITRCLARDPAKRITLDELLTRLEAADSSPARLAVPQATVAAQGTAPVAPAAAPASAAERAPVLTARPASSAATQAMPNADGTRTIGPSAPIGYPSNPPLPSVLFGTYGWRVTEIAFSPDGRLLAGGLSQGGTWRVQIWDASTGELAGAPVEGRGATPKMAFSPGGVLLTLKEAGASRLLSLLPRQFVALSADRAEHSWRKVRFSPDGRLLATMREVRRMSGFDGTQVRLWDCQTLLPVAGPLKVDLMADDSTVAFSPDGSYLFLGHEGQGSLGDVTAAQPSLRKLRGIHGTAGRAAFSADGQLLAVQSAKGNAVAVFETAEIVLGNAAPAPAVTLACDREITRIGFSPVSALLAIAMVSGGNEAIECWNLATPTDALSWPASFAGHYPASRTSLTGFRLPLSELRFSPDGAFIAAASRPGSRDRRAAVRIWPVGNAEPDGSLDLPGPVRITFSPDSRFLAATGADHAVRLLRLPTPSHADVLPGTSGVFSPAAGQIATAEPAGVRLWTLPESR